MEVIDIDKINNARSEKNLESKKREKCIKNTDTDETESIQSVKVKGYQS